MKAKLTDRYVKAIQPPQVGRTEVIDLVQPGLRLRVTSKGAMSWSVALRVAGRMRRFTIGPYPEISLGDARRRAASMMPEIRDGHDPVKKSRQERLTTAAPNGINLTEAIDAYADARLGNRRTGDTIVRDLKRDLGALLDAPVKDITTPMLATIVDRKAKTAPIQANRLVASMKPFWRWLATRQHCDVDAASILEKPSTERARDRVLSQKEIAAIWQATTKMSWYWRDCYRLLLLTAQRRSEAAAMAWAEIGFDSAQWVIPAERTKTGVEHIVHLSEPTLAIVSDLQVKQSTDTDLIFTTTGKTPISGFSKSKRELDQLSGVDNWKIHDFRRTAVSHMADIGIDPTVADRVLNHVAAGSMSTVQRVYQRSSMLQQRRRALDAWADFVLACTQNKDQFQGNG